MKIIENYDILAESIYTILTETLIEKNAILISIEDLIVNYNSENMFLIAFMLRNLDTCVTNEEDEQSEEYQVKFVNLVYKSKLIDNSDKLFLLTLFNLCNFPTPNFNLNNIFSQYRNIIYTASIFLDKPQYLSKRNTSRNIILDAIKYHSTSIFRKFIDKVKKEEYFLQYSIDNFNLKTFTYLIGSLGISYRLLDRLILLAKLFHISKLYIFENTMFKMLYTAIVYGHNLDIYQLKTIKSFNMIKYNLIHEKNRESHCNIVCKSDLCENGLCVFKTTTLKFDNSKSMFHSVCYEDDSLTFCFTSTYYDELIRTGINPTTGHKLPNYIIKTIKSCKRLIESEKDIKCEIVCRDTVAEITKESNLYYEKFLDMYDINEDALNFETLQEIKNENFHKNYIILDSDPNNLKHSTISLAREIQ